jgi:hypothetical protein
VLGYIGQANAYATSLSEWESSASLVSAVPIVIAIDDFNFAERVRATVTVAPVVVVTVWATKGQGALAPTVPVIVDVHSLGVSEVSVGAAFGVRFAHVVCTSKWKSTASTTAPIIVNVDSLSVAKRTLPATVFVRVSLDIWATKGQSTTASTADPVIVNVHSFSVAEAPLTAACVRTPLGSRCAKTER